MFVPIPALNGVHNGVRGRVDDADRGTVSECRTVAHVHEFSGGVGGNIGGRIYHGDISYVAQSRNIVNMNETRSVVSNVQPFCFGPTVRRP